VAVSIVMTAYTNNGKTSSAGRNCGRQPKLNERYCHTLKRIASKNHRTAAAKVAAELSTHLERPCFRENCPKRCANTVSTVELELLNP
jgi:hypothetical protein